MQQLPKFYLMDNATLRALSHVVDDYGRPTMNARLAGHQFDANVRSGSSRQARHPPPGPDASRCSEARASARYNRTPSGWARYGESAAGRVAAVGEAAMSAHKVDVLAVMDADIARRQRTAQSLMKEGRPCCERINDKRITEMAEARAAVAELIEALRNRRATARTPAATVTPSPVTDAPPSPA